MVDKIIETLKSIAIIVLLLLSGYGLYSLVKDDGTKVEIQEVVKTETKYVSVTDTVEVYIPQITTEYITIHDTVTVTKKEFVEVYKDLTEDEKLDIVENHFTKKTYVDTLVVDGYGQVFLKDELYKNSIFSRNYSYDFSIPYEKETVILTPQRLKLYLGAEVNYFIKEPSYSDNSPFAPRAYAGAEYRIGDNHFLEATYDPIWKDFRAGYDYRKNNLEVGARYSTRWNYLTLEGKYYITK
jgi:hypothetical protein